MNEDAELLRRYVDDRSDAAFKALVERHIAFVYGAALRQLGGATHRAEDVVQTVFLALARKAPFLVGHPQLLGWLHTSTRYACARLKRSEQRRQQREQEAVTMQEAEHRGGEINWDELRPVLDDALHALGERDRELVLMRFFQGLRFADIGRASGLSEDAARMRTERALARLRERLAKRRITSTTAALALALANQPAVAVPPALAASVAAAALTGGGAAMGLGAGAMLFVMKTKTVLVSAAALLAVAFGTYEWQQARDARAEIEALNREQASLKAQLARSLTRNAEPEKTLRAAFASPSRQATPSIAPNRATTANVTGLALEEGRMSFTMATPEQARARNAQNIDHTYAALYRQLGWSAEQRERFRSIMLDQQESGSRLLRSAVADAKAKNPELGRAEMFEIHEATQVQIQREQQAEVRRQLGDSAGQALELFQDSLPARSVANQVATALFHTESPITPEQAVQLSQVLADHARGPLGRVDMAALNVDAAIAQVQQRGLLNSTQIAELRRVAQQAQERAKPELTRVAVPLTASRPKG